MDDKLPMKTAKFTSLENLYVYGSGLTVDYEEYSKLIVDLFWLQLGVQAVVECHPLAGGYLLTRKMCLSAVTSQSSKGHPANLQALDLAISGGQLSSSQ